MLSCFWLTPHPSTLPRICWGREVGMQTVSSYEPPAYMSPSSLPVSPVQLIAGTTGSLFVPEVAASGYSRTLETLRGNSWFRSIGIHTNVERWIYLNIELNIKWPIRVYISFCWWLKSIRAMPKGEFQLALSVKTRFWNDVSQVRSPQQGLRTVSRWLLPYYEKSPNTTIVFFLSIE